MGEIHPEENGLAGGFLALEEVHRTLGELVIASLHPLLSYRASVLDRLLTDLAEAPSHRRVVSVGRFAVRHAARAELGEKMRKVLGIRVVWQFRFFGGVQVLERAVELIEAARGGQVFMPVTEMVL